jgi:hypothetical protein
MLRRRHAKTCQKAVVLFISDLDPSGLDLQRAWEDALRAFGAPVDEFVRIGLTREQVDALPNAQLRQGIEVKPSDSRAENYIAEYGGRCWETDILPAATMSRPSTAKSAPASMSGCGTAEPKRSGGLAFCSELVTHTPSVTEACACFCSELVTHKPFVTGLAPERQCSRPTTDNDRQPPTIVERCRQASYRQTDKVPIADLSLSVPLAIHHPMDRWTDTPVRRFSPSTSRSLILA